FLPRSRLVEPRFLGVQVLRVQREGEGTLHLRLLQPVQSSERPETEHLDRATRSEPADQCSENHSIFAATGVLVLEIQRFFHDYQAECAKMVFATLCLPFISDPVRELLKGPAASVPFR